MQLVANKRFTLLGTDYAPGDVMQDAVWEQELNRRQRQVMVDGKFVVQSVEWERSHPPAIPKPNATATQPTKAAAKKRPRTRRKRVE